MRMLKIGVIGSGPSGLAFALAATRAGHQVTAVEARNEISSGGTGVIIQPAGLAAAEVLGIREALEAAGHRIHCVHGELSAPRRQIINLRYDLADTHAIAIERAALMNILLTHSGCSVKTGTPIATITPTATGASLQGPDGNAIGEFDVVVDASGPLARIEGRPYTQQCHAYPNGSLWSTVHLDHFEPGQGKVNQVYGERSESVGFMHVGAKQDETTLALFWSMTRERLQVMKRRGLDHWKAETLRLDPRLAPVLAKVHSWDQLNLATFYNVSHKRTANIPVVPIGDSAHAVNPIIGQGVSAGLVDAVLLAQLLSTEANVMHAITTFEQRRGRQMFCARAAAKLLVPFYQSDNPVYVALRNLFAGKMMSLPIINRLAPMLVAGLWPDPGFMLARS